MAHQHVLPAENALCRADTAQRQRNGHQRKQRIQQRISDPLARRHEGAVSRHKSIRVAEKQVRIHRRRQPATRLDEEEDKLRQARDEGNQQHNGQDGLDGSPSGLTVFFRGTHKHFSFYMDFGVMDAVSSAEETRLPTQSSTKAARAVIMYARTNTGSRKTQTT